MQRSTVAPNPRTSPASSRSRWLLGLLVFSVPAAGLGWLLWREREAASLWREATHASRQGAWSEVQGILARYERLRPRDPAALRMGAVAASKLGQDEPALRLLDLAERSSRSSSDFTLLKGQILMRGLRIGQAEAAFRACLGRDGDSDEALRQLLVILGVERRDREYDDWLWRIHDASPGPRALLSLILMAAAPPETSPTVLVPEGVRVENPEEAVLRRWLAADPQNPAVPRLLADRLRRDGLRDEARRILEPRLEAHPDDLDARAEWLAVLIEEHDLAPARAWLDPIPEAAIDRSRFWKLRGDWLAERRLEAPALDAYRESSRLEPRDPEALFRLYQELRSRGHDEAAEVFARLRDLQALKALARRLSEQPGGGSVDSWREAARLCTSLGRHREAAGWAGQLLLQDRPAADDRGESGDRSPRPGP